MATKTVSDSKQASLLSALGLSGSVSLQDLEWQFYSANSGLTPANKYSITDHKLAYYKLNGAAGASIRDVETAFFKSQGAAGTAYDDIALDFFNNYGFNLGPNSLTGLALWLDSASVNSQQIAYDDGTRRNLASSVDPSMETGISNWAFAGGLTGTWDTAQAHTGTHSLKVVSTGGQFSYIGVNNTPIGATTFSIWVFTTTGGTFSLQVEQGSPSFGASSVNGPNVNVAANTWTRLSLTTTRPVGETSTTLLVYGPANGTWWLDDLQYEAGSVATPFTWGDSSHLGVSPSGHAWIISTGAGDGIVSGQLISNGNDQTAMVLDVGTPDVDISLDFTDIPTSTSNVGIVFRYTDANTFYLANRGQLFKKTGAGAFTALGTGYASGTLNGSGTMRVVCIGINISVYWNGVLQASITDTTYQTQTKHGAYRATVGAAYDNLIIKTPTYSDGAALPIWPDLSGNYRHVTQSNATKQPLFRSASPNLVGYDTATFEISTGGWVVVSGPTLARSTAQFKSGAASLAATLVVGLNQNFWRSPNLIANGAAPVTPGKTYRVSFAARCSSTTDQIRASFKYYDAGGTQIALQSTNDLGVIGNSGFTTFNVTDNAPAPTGAVACAIEFSTGPSVPVVAGDIIYIDEFAIYDTTNIPSSWKPPVTLPNAKPAIQFDGVAHTLSNALVSGVNQQYTIFVVAKVENVNQFNGLICYENIYFRLNNGTGKQNVDKVATSGIGTGTNNQIGAWHVLETTGDWSLNPVGWAFYADGAADGAGTVGPVGPVTNVGIALQVGSRDVNNEFTMGTVAAIVMYNRVLNTSERQRIEKYLKTRFGTP